MSNRPFFLLTGDDSVRAEGIILVKRLIQDWADFQIIATNKQMSGVGSGMSMPGGTYGTEQVDGHEAIWVSGKPTDAVYFATQYITRPIDMVISGMNLGQNITNEMHRSGTVGAAVTAAQCRDLKAIAISSEVPSDKFFMQHTGTLNESLLEYPGKMLLKLIQLAHQHPFPPQTFWNINVPVKPTTEIAVVPASNNHYWVNDLSITHGAYAYLDTFGEELQPGEDSYELGQGKITITPCKVEYTDFSQLDRVKELVATL